MTVTVTAAESKIMEALWRHGEMTVAEIIDDIARTEAWGQATVKTLVNRLLKKKAIQSAKAVGRHVYRPLLQRAVSSATRCGHGSWPGATTWSMMLCCSPAS